MSDSPNSQKVVSVVIVSYNVCDFVIAGIESLYQYVKSPLQIIVVDNNSTDNTLETIKSKFPKVEIIANNHNAGFSAANNQGFKKCTGDFILMFNPDALLIDDSINKMIDELDRVGEKSILIGPQLINTDNSFQTSCWKFPNPFQHLLELFFLNTLIDTTKYSSDYLSKKTKVDFISGACILMKKSTCEKLNGLDENLFWMDDADFCKRNQEEGGETIYFPVTTVKHHIGQSSKKNQKVVISNQIKSKIKFYKKHNAYFSYIISVPILFLQMVTRIPLFYIIGIMNKKYLDKANAYAFTLTKFFSAN